MNVSFINRSRHVGQSYFSSIFTTLWAFFTVIPLVYRIRPKLVCLLSDLENLIVFFLIRFLLMVPVHVFQLLLLVYYYQ